MSKIYLVYGVSGEFDDKREWIVRAFKNEEAADLLGNQLNNFCKENGLIDNPEYPSREAREKILQLDSEAHWNDPGIYYYLQTCELEE